MCEAQLEPPSPSAPPRPRILPQRHPGACPGESREHRGPLASIVPRSRQWVPATSAGTTLDALTSSENPKRAVIPALCRDPGQQTQRLRPLDPGTKPGVTGCLGWTPQSSPAIMLTHESMGRGHHERALYWWVSLRRGALRGEGRAGQPAHLSLPSLSEGYRCRLQCAASFPHRGYDTHRPRRPQGLVRRRHARLLHDLRHDDLFDAGKRKRHWPHIRLARRPRALQTRNAHLDLLPPALGKTGGRPAGV